ncbi:MAG: CinA family protein [Candidatus Aureabacteria bacterium]|nr:CinA family protein [Candidatus Auribacterota bacterium]
MKQEHIYNRNKTRSFLKKLNEKKSLKKIFFYLKKRHWALSCAESCTGGLLSFIITSKPGASDIFQGGVVAYSNEIKESFLGVSKETLRRFGAVSGDAVEEMALGALRMFRSDVSVSISGIAGPSGASREKPLGLIWIAVCIGSSAERFSFHFGGNRKRIRHMAARAALYLTAEKLGSLVRKNTGTA